MINGVPDAALASGKIVFPGNTEGDPQVEPGVAELKLEHREGIINASVHDRVADPPKNGHKALIMLADCYCEDRSLPSAVPDESQGAPAATELVLS